MGKHEHPLAGVVVQRLFQPLPLLLLVLKTRVQQHRIEHHKQTIIVLKAVTLRAEMLLVLRDGRCGDGNLIIDSRQGGVNLFTDVVISWHQMAGHGQNFARLVEGLCRGQCLFCLRAPPGFAKPSVKEGQGTEHCMFEWDFPQQTP